MENTRKPFNVRMAVSRIVAMIAFGVVSCAHAPTQVAGGGSDTEVSGRVLTMDGTAKAGVAVTLIATQYDPAFDGLLPQKMMTLTDTTGRYRFDSLTQGTYNIQAGRGDDGTKILVGSIIVDSGTTQEAPEARLQKTATINVGIPDSLRNALGYVIAPGTLLAKPFIGRSMLVTFDSVPQGILSSIQFKRSKTDNVVLYRSVVVSSTDTIGLNPWQAWLHSAQIALNTTAAGAGTGETETNFPVLVRLTKANFNFSQAKPNGEDIRFVKQDYSSLPFEIEEWDSAAGTTSLWVNVDTVWGNSSNQYFRILWGNPSAKTASNPSAVFDTGNGFQGVWHLRQSGGTIQKDATVNHFDGTPYGMSGASDRPGVIGRAQEFNGTSNYISIDNSITGKLDVPKTSFYSISAWVYSQQLDNDIDVIVSKGSTQYGLEINEKKYWEFYGSTAKYGLDTSTAIAAVQDRWTYLTGIRSATRQYLYVDGSLVDSAIISDTTKEPVTNTANTLVFGKQAENPSQWFKGFLDEVRISNRSYSPDWIKLCFENQRADQTLVLILNAH